MKTITQDMISKACVSAMEFIKPSPFAVIVVNKTNQKMLTENVNVFKAENGYDAIQLGVLDDVDYGSDYHNDNGELKIGVGITLAISAGGVLDAYPNATINDPEKFKRVECTDDSHIDSLKKLGVSDGLCKEIIFFTKLVKVPMVKVSELKKALNISDHVAIQATWGLQNDVEDHDFVVLVEGDAYKVDMDAETGLPEKYIEV